VDLSYRPADGTAGAMTDAFAYGIVRQG
jgi:hypothetical protein